MYCSQTPVADDPLEVFKIDWLLHYKIKVVNVGIITK
jgi:hypothetical protein